MGNDMEDIIRERQIVYSILARIFRKEADEELLNAIKNFDYSHFDENSEDNFDKGFLLLQKAANKFSKSSLLDLARDYARTFLGAGLGRGEGAYPYESFYTSPERLLMQEARDEVMFEYGSEMLKRSDEFTEPEDHIAFEFEYMAVLCGKTQRALENKNIKMAEKYIAKQHTFFVKHLDNWVHLFCKDVIKKANEDFYKAAAIITLGLLEEEKLMFETK